MEQIPDSGGPKRKAIGAITAPSKKKLKFMSNQEKYEGKRTKTKQIAAIFYQKNTT